MGGLFVVFASIDVPQLELEPRQQRVSVPVRVRLMERTLMLMPTFPHPAFLGIMYFAVIFVSNFATVLIFVVRLLHFHCSVPASLTTDLRRAVRTGMCLLGATVFRRHR